MFRLKKNRLFRFTASVRLAVPLMLLLGGLVAYGTILESQFNSDYAKLTIYDSGWFLALLALLFLNILNSTLSRWPWRRHHLGFVTTHLGLLTLLTGAFITAFWGVDGQLRVREGDANSTVVLPRLMLSYRLDGAARAQSVVFDKTLKEPTSLDFINDKIGHVVRAEQLLPFASLEKTFAPSAGHEDEVALSFILRSQFFNVSEWLHSKDNPEMQLGPAHLRLIQDRADASPASNKIVPLRTGSDTVVVKDAESRRVLVSWSLKGKSFMFHGVRFALKRKMEHAVVTQNKITENPTAGAPNPALELEVSQGAQVIREILVAKYPNFSLNKNGLFGYVLEYRSAAESDEETSEESREPAQSPGGNVIEFHVRADQPKQARVILLKNGQTVASHILAEGQNFQTPWMGSKIFLGTLAWGSSPHLEAHTTLPQRGQDLPPSAIRLHVPNSDESFWLAEGETHAVTFNGRRAEVYFGRETLDLPFAVHLKKFTKIDYPGTETPMSYESDVEVDGKSENIAMNEPLKKDGYTIYQASYVINENEPPDSIFSVNRDPGRPVKYGGSLILALGIIIFTITRSRWYNQRFGTL